MTLDEAIGKGLEIAETGPDGTVPELTVTNPLDEAVLLYDGEELVGAKQNRILDVSVLVAAGSKLTIPVSCVEQGRWRSVSRTFSAAPHVSSTDLRRAKAAALASRGTRSRRRAGRGLAIRPDEAPCPRRRLRHRCKPRCVRRSRAPDRGTRERVRGRPGQCGAVLGIGDALCLDVVSRPEAFAVLWPKLRAGYLLDALGHLDGRRRAPSACSRSSTRSPMLRPAAGRPRAWAPTCGYAGRCSAPVELDDELIQLSAFTADQDRSARAVGGRIALAARGLKVWERDRLAGPRCPPAGRCILGRWRDASSRIGGFSSKPTSTTSSSSSPGARASVPTAQGIISIRVLMLIVGSRGLRAFAARTLRDRFAAPPSGRGRRALMR